MHDVEGGSILIEVGAGDTSGSADAATQNELLLWSACLTVIPVIAYSIL